MNVLFLGILFIVTIMVTTMGGAFIHYLRKDLKWENTTDRSIQAWYNR